MPVRRLKAISPSRYDLALGAAFGSLILVLMLVVAWAAGTYIQHANNKEEEKLASMLGALLKDSVERIGFSGKHHTRLLVEEVSERLPGVNAIQVSDLEGERIAHSDASLVGSTIPLEQWRSFEPLLAGKVALQIRTLQTESGRSLEVSQTYYSGFQNKLAGVVTLEVSTADYERDLQEGLGLLAMLILVLLLISTTIVIWLSKLFGETVRESELKKQLAEQEAKTAGAESRAKSDFLAMMSHEIRTPMNGVLGMAQLLEHTPLNDEQRHHLQVINDCGQSLLEIINDILDYSKISAGKLQLENVDVELRTTIQDCLELFSVKAQESGIPLLSEVSANIPLCIKTDPLRLRQILVNLISNAYKFTDSGQIRLRVEQVGKSTQRLRFELIDSGIGISTEQQARLFSPFTQADSSTSRQYGGTGLGLAICKQLLDCMGGEIGVDSKLQQGSRFWFEIPLVPGTATDFNPVMATVTTARSASTAAVPVYPQLRVLVAEDNANNLQVIEGMLDMFEIRPQLVPDGLAAVKAATAPGQGFDLILMDFEMPAMDGYTATREIRKMLQASDNGQREPVIIGLSAHVSAEHRERALTAGMNDCLGKPVMPGDLERILLEYFPVKA